MAARDTYRYRFVSRGKIVHKGITIDPDRREKEHKQRWPNGQLVVEGPVVTRRTALEWESDQKKTITPDPKNN